jgi:hypothetical protein
MIHTPKKREYAPPTLRVIGELRSLTLGGQGSCTDEGNQLQGNFSNSSGECKP